jgi:hypothetical protein
MDCDRIRDDLGRREAGLLDPGAAGDLERHLAGCDACRAWSRRMSRLVAVLEDFPQVRELPRRSALRRLSRGRVAVVAAAILMALAVPLVGPLVGPRTALEGGFDLPARNVLVSRDSSSALVADEHRMRFRKGTRVRIVGADEVFLEEGRLDVSGLREGASGLKIGTPLGRIKVLGTRFVVEVTPVNKTKAAVAAGGFIVGVMVSSGVVTYADYRLQAGEGIVDETGKSPRRVAATDVERRLRTAAAREREMETRLAALGAEKERLGRELAALERGEVPPARVQLTPEDRRARSHRLAQVLVKNFFPVQPVANEVPFPLDEEELRRQVQEKGTVKVEQQIETRVETDGKAMAEVLELANDLGMNFFDAATFCSKAEMVEELMMAVLEARAATASGLRPAIESAVRSAYGSLPGSWESKAEERLAQARAVQGALSQLEGSVSADQARDLYETATAILRAPEYAFLGYMAQPGSTWRTEWIDRLAKTMALEAADRPILEAAVDDLAARLVKEQGKPSTGAKSGFESMIRARDAGAEFVRRLTARFPDRKDKIEYAVEPR